MKNTFIFLIILSFSACKKEKQLKLPVLITSEYDTIIQVSYDRMIESNPIVYGVNFKDTFNFSTNYIRNLNDYISYSDMPLSDSIVVYVDDKNSNFHSHEINYLEFTPPPPPRIIDSVFDNRLHDYKYAYVDVNYSNLIKEQKQFKEKRKKKHFSTYPVFIYNEANKNRIISSSIINGELYLLVEAKDKKGIWRPIEYNDVPGRICGPIDNYLLKPKHSIISSILKYSGNYKTKMRVKFMTSEKIYYSNEFEGSINYSQFDFVDEIDLMNKRFSDSTNETHEYKKKLILLDFD